MDGELQDRLRKLPKVDALLADAQCELLLAEYGRTMVVDALRAALDEARNRLRVDRQTGGPGVEQIVRSAGVRLLSGSVPSLRRVVNATGIVLHTNLGRAPIGEEAIRAIQEVSSGYSNLEYDLAAGERGSRQTHVEALLCRHTGAGAALVVNNNAAAVMLAVNTVARDGEVITSRGELIEIGGSFRIPDVIETSEARLVETGTTNRTRVEDFSQAITPITRALLRVHPSNYRVVGFTESPSREEIVALAHEHGLAAMEDLGSGTLVDLSQYGVAREPTVQEAVAAGMDIVTFSGDKLLGGPQAGIAAGRAEIIARMKRNPLYRALRVGKMTLAALESTLRAYLNPETMAPRIPVLRMLSQMPADLEARAERVAALFEAEGYEVSVRAVESHAGGGSLPGEAIADFAVALRDQSLRADALHATLRSADPPIVTRVADGEVLLHMLAVSDDDVRLIESALTRLVP